MFRKDRNRYRGRIIFYVSDNLRCKSLTTEIDNLTETIFLEVNVRSSKWIFVGCYKPPSSNEEFFISNLSKIINAFLTKYDNILVMGDFNLTVENKHLEELLNLFNLFKAWFPPGDKSRFYRQMGDKSKVIAKMAITLFWCEC